MTVSDLLTKRAGAAWQSVAFGNEVVKPLALLPLLTHPVSNSWHVWWHGLILTRSCASSLVASCSVWLLLCASHKKQTCICSMNPPTS